MVINISHYSFFEIAQPKEAQESLTLKLLGKNVLGTVLISTEGINLNLAGPEEQALPAVREWLTELGAPDLEFRKMSYSWVPPFKHLKIKVKNEIVTMGVEGVDVPKYTAPHMPTEKFKELLRDPGEFLILDNRNDFEVALGTFRGAVAAGTKTFREFPKIADGLPKEKPIVMFCTGGIRCEKASAFLKKEGFENIFQLQGGILGYLEEQGFENFDGKCFVFDERVVVEEESFKKP